MSFDRHFHFFWVHFLLKGCRFCGFRVCANTTCNIRVRHGRLSRWDACGVRRSVSRGDAV